MRGRAVLCLLATLAACAEPGDGRQPQQGQGVPAAALPAPNPGGEDGSARRGLDRPDGPAPDVYMALQPDSGGAVSVVFAIDASRDGTPGDDPAVRITPENGGCNPQELSRFAFAPGAVPVFGPDEAARGVGAADLPAFMAVGVTRAMLDRGLARDREATAPQNICTRKLWERLVTGRSGQ